MPVVPEAVMEQEFREHSKGMLIDGIAFSTTAGVWSHVPLQLPQALHIQEAFLEWDGCKFGDYGFIVAIHPSGCTNLKASASQGATTVNVGAAYAPYYNPANGKRSIEFWNSDEDNLLEVRTVTGVSGAEVSFTPGLAAARDTSVLVKPVFGRYGPIRGANGNEGGFRMVTGGRVTINNPYSISAKLPAGFLICVRVKTSSEAGTRMFAVNFLFREPEEA